MSYLFITNIYFYRPKTYEAVKAVNTWKWQLCIIMDADISLYRAFERGTKTIQLFSNKGLLVVGLFVIGLGVWYVWWL